MSPIYPLALLAIVATTALAFFVALGRLPDNPRRHRQPVEDASDYRAEGDVPAIPSAFNRGE